MTAEARAVFTDLRQQSVQAKWFGKTFLSATDVQPLICLDDEGNKSSNLKLGKGEASLWMEEFRGELTATMVYDGQPTHDHFKKIDDDAVMGIMNGKNVLDFSGGRGRYFYFYLEREPSDPSRPQPRPRTTTRHVTPPGCGR